MKEQAENYKGIDFIRISKLPTNQKEIIVKTISSKKIIKILKDKELVVDCIQYRHYASWYDLTFKVASEEKKIESTVPKKKVAIRVTLDH